MRASTIVLVCNLLLALSHRNKPQQYKLIIGANSMGVVDPSDYAGSNLSGLLTQNETSKHDISSSFVQHHDKPRRRKAVRFSPGSFLNLSSLSNLSAESHAQSDEMQLQGVQSWPSELGSCTDFETPAGAILEVDPEPIDNGAFASVFKAILTKKPSNNRRFTYATAEEGIPVVVRVVDLFEAQKLDQHAPIKSESATHWLMMLFLKHVNHTGLNNVIDMHEYWETAPYTTTGRQHLVSVLEYANEGNLWKYLDSKLPLNIDTVQQYTKQLALGLAAMHEAGFAHLDLKPENVLVNKVGGQVTLKLCDFGLVQKADQELDTLQGTFEYLSPELIQAGLGEPEKYRGPPADVWALACLVYWMFAGKDVFTHPARLPGPIIAQIMEGPVVHPYEWNSASTNRVVQDITDESKYGGKATQKKRGQLATLLLNMLQTTNRFTMAQVLNDAFITEAA